MIKAGAPAAGHANPALARLIAQVTSIPVRTSDAAGDGADRVITKPAAVAGPLLTARGKPEILYVATEYCPYCATQSWAMIVALSRFGTFTGLRAIRSVTFDAFPPPRCPQPFRRRVVPNHPRLRRVVHCDGRCEEGP